MGLFESIKKLLKRWKRVNFTPRAQQVFTLARKEADRLNHNYIGTEHLLLGLVNLGQRVTVSALQSTGVSLEILRTEVEKITGYILYTPRLKRVLDLARREAKNLNHTYIGTEHLLLGLLREGHGIGALALTNCEVNLEQLRTSVLKELDPNFGQSETGK